MTNLSINPKTTHILLIGTGEYEDQEHFENIPQIKNNLQELSRLFAQESVLGVFNHHITIAYNKRDEEIFLTISNLCDDPSIKTLIIYYAGHSCITNQGEFYLTASNSRKRIIEKNGINFKHIKNQIKEAEAEQVVFLLDTCRSGRLSIHNEREYWLPKLNYKKTWMITSSPQHRPSYYSPLSPFTYFTGALIQVLSQGIESNQNTIDLSELNKAIQQELSSYPEKSLPKSGYWSNSNQKFLVFKNRAFRSSMQEPKFDDGLRSLDTTTVTRPSKSKPKPNIGFMLLFMVIVFGALYLWNHQLERLPEQDNIPTVEEYQEANQTSSIIGNWEDEERALIIRSNHTYTFTFKKEGVVKTGQYTLSQDGAKIKLRLSCPKSNWHYLLAGVEIRNGKMYYRDWHQNQITLSGV